MNTTIDMQAKPPSNVAIESLSKRFGDGLPVVNNLSFEIKAGEFFSLLGPSGCGKTTLLRMLAGFESPTAGKIRIGGQDITELSAHQRDIGMVFQSYALFPHRTVAENVGFGLKMRGVSSAETAKRVHEALALVKLTDFAARKPNQLSGGQQQRVALARAFVIRPQLLLCDEPLGALDRKLRVALQAELKALQRTLGVTLVFVTHDQEEALSMSDRIGIMNAGKLEQIGTPAEIYNRPRSEFVAQFIGNINLFSGFRRQSQLMMPDGRDLPAPFGAEGLINIGVRPERIQIVEQGTGLLNGVIEEATFLGDHVSLSIRTRYAVPLMVKQPMPTEHSLSRGDQVAVHWTPDDCVILSEG